MASTEQSPHPRVSRALDGTESSEGLPVGPAWGRSHQHHSLDLIGNIYEAGTTWYEYQQNGTVGRMIQADDSGFVHLVWMNALDASWAVRHVYYNVWDPSTEEFIFPGGVQVDASIRAGYTTQTIAPSGYSFPVFHAIPSGETLIQMAAAFDFEPRLSAFETSFPSRPGGDDYSPAWPKSSRDGNGILHIVSTSDAEPYAYLYSRGTPLSEGGHFVSVEWQSFGASDFFEIGSGRVIAADITASQNSNRVAIIWYSSRGGDVFLVDYNNDIMLSISEDGGLTWAGAINISEWAEPDLLCESGDTVACNRDTLRAYTCASILFDDEDVIHVAFTTRVCFEFSDPDGSGPNVHSNQSGIWHWSEEYEEYSPVANAYYYMTADNFPLRDGAWQSNVQRPSLAYDSVSGDLYCSYLLNDSTQWSDNNWTMADVWLTKSEDGGRVWKQGINLTETDGGQDAPSGESLSERDACLAPRVTHSGDEGFLHLQYVLDTDAGGSAQDEGAITECPVYYQRIPVSSLSFADDLDPAWPTMHVDSSGMPGRVIPFDNECLTPQNLSIVYDGELAQLQLNWQRSPFGCQCFRLWYTVFPDAVFPDDYVILQSNVSDTTATVQLGSSRFRTFVVQSTPCP